ncbi:unnamed protein product [Eruca vesicaria subsp. sativa]|uniref:Uncharacterized protein n=1 Tax=Eruca vesicaria subsp. sativa TaxID=29727 RepID=A0ABC8JM68_ERUVS|nr:unnamed protein product [Eruca vesicaria subsp. sativa]
MARPNNNKNTALNYNHILQKAPSSSSSPASYSSVTRSNGRMLVLTKPSPKPLKSYAAASTTTATTDQAITDPDPNQISLRPLGHTGPASSLSFPSRTQESEKIVAAPPALASFSPKPDRFVPPHLRPGFVRKDEKPGLASSSSSSILGLPHQEQPRQGYSGYGHTGRPKSGGHERIGSDPEYLGRPRSSGNRPGTSG